MRLLLLAIAAAVSLPLSRAEAQTPEAAGVPAGRACTLRVVDPAGVTRREGTIINILDPFRVICDDGANLRASSGTFDQVERVVTLTGDVYFEDVTRSLTSDRAVYDNQAGVLHATGNVIFVDRAEGTTLTGPELEYYRATEQREQALVNAYGRPRLTMERPPGADTAAVDTAGSAPSGGAPTATAEGAASDTAGMPLTIDADQMTIVGEDDLTAVGNVVIQDDEMRAVADEAEQRGASETLELRGNSSIHSREYSLAAEVIFATIPEGSIREVEARRNARLLGEDLNVDAPQLNLLFEDNLLQRTVARSDSSIAPGVRPLATSPTFRLEADSIDAGLPGQQLELVVAIGDARGEMIDTTRTAAPGDSLQATVDGQLEIEADSAAAVAVDSLQPQMPGRIAAVPEDSLPGTPIDSLPGTPVDSLRGTPVDSLPGTPVDSLRGTPVDSLRGTPIDSLPGVPVDSLPGVRIDSVDATPGAATGSPADEGAIDPMFASGDTVLTVSAERLVQNDWITGDTITGYFTTLVATPEDSVAGEAEENGESEAPLEEGQDAGSVPQLEPDTTPPAGSDTTLVLQRLVALGAARSLYHVAPEEGSPPETRPGINFLSAARIELTFDAGQVDVAEVSGLRRGLYLEPLAPGDTVAEEGPEDAEGEPAGEGAEEEPAPEGAEGEPRPEDAGVEEDPMLPPDEPQGGGASD